MRTKEFKSETEDQKRFSFKYNLRATLSLLFFAVLILFGSLKASAHCDSFDGPTVKDALKALETKNVNLVLKWISQDQEKDIVPLFHKTYGLRNGDKEVYAIVEKHFLETLVRLHRETEGAPFTGLKPAGSTKLIVQLSDKALQNNDINDLLGKLNNHISKVILEKYEKVAMLDKVKEESPEKGREFVAAYVDYTHTLEAIHDILEHGGGHAGHNH
jgi:hypothetical protein